MLRLDHLIQVELISWQTVRDDMDVTIYHIILESARSIPWDIQHVDVVGVRQVGGVED